MYLLAAIRKLSDKIFAQSIVKTFICCKNKNGVNDRTKMFSGHEAAPVQKIKRRTRDLAARRMRRRAEALVHVQKGRQSFQR